MPYQKSGCRRPNGRSAPEFAALPWGDYRTLGKDLSNSNEGEQAETNAGTRTVELAMGPLLGEALIASRGP